MTTYDGIIIGAGHNGLITQAYLAKAGLKVISLDAGPVAGGGLPTVEDEKHPGFFHNLHSYFHRGITSMPWFTDLKLARYGVEYLENDLYVSVLQRDGNVLQWWNDFEQTYRSFAEIDRDDADRLRYWRDRFIPITRDIIRPEAAAPPEPVAVRRERLQKFEDGRLLLQVSEFSPCEFVSQEFNNPAIKGALLFINGMREMDLRAKGFGHHLPSLFASSAQVQTCRGGAVSLARALVRSIEASGGTVRTNAPSPAIPRLARLNHRPPWRMELLLQAARTKNHVRRIGPLRIHDHRLRYRSSVKSVNPVAVAWSDTSRLSGRYRWIPIRRRFRSFRISGRSRGASRTLRSPPMP
ncbi:NAD(P)-binding protein [Acidiphilium sp. AL]|uniref:phytoene desaturase family protein n=1 Tax=Acidiphilium sp. AL TaxID=2871704 RepID=UPI0021CAF349|nr:NAD(P)-binding protein [Acidiphilium sp. AL]MCU4161846.1 NAD(P)-binding protein [Acidiphilium sp. AL]